MNKSKLTMQIVSSSLSIACILIAYIIAFWVINHPRDRIIFEEELFMSSITYSVSKNSVDLQKIAMSPNKPIKLNHMEDTKTDEERMEDRVYLYSHIIAEKYGIEPSLIIAVAKKESRFNPNVNGSGAIGLMQIIPSCHGDRISRLEVSDIWDPYSNLLIGADLLAELLSKYKDVGLALMCYNMGEGTALYKYNSYGYSGYAREVLRIKEEIERSEKYGTYSHQTKVASSESRDSRTEMH